MLSIVLVMTACDKKANGPAPAPDPKVGSAAPDPGSAAAAPGSAAADPGSAAADPGSAAADPKAPAAGSGTPAVVDSVAGAVKMDAGAAEENPRTSPLCSKVLEKIVECQKDKGFIEALNEGAEDAQVKLNKRFLKEVARWKEADTNCMNLAPAIEYMGFLNKWDRVASVPDAVESCGKLGTVINSAGGLFGGDRAY
jgi:hypothetical protein